MTASVLKLDKWFSFSLNFFIFFDRFSVVLKCRFVAGQSGLPRKFAGFVLS